MTGRGLLGRRIGRQMIAFAALFGVIAAIVFVTVPVLMDPSAFSIEAPYGLAFVGAIVGFVWMVRIYRADPEPDQGAWRYREKR